MRILEQYIVRELLRPFAVVLIILAGLFAGFSSARFLAEAVTESLGIFALLKLVLLRTLIAQEVLIPVALYVAVIVGLGRLHRDQEIIVMKAAGVGGFRVIYAVLLLAIPVGIVSGGISLFARPWAYTQSYLLDAQAKAELNTDRFQAGRFYGNDSSSSVIYIQARNPGSRQMEDVFYYVDKEDGSKVIIAREAERQLLPGQWPQLHLFDGFVYELKQSGTEDSIVKFEKLVHFTGGEDEVGYKRKAAFTPTLLESDQPRDIAELQWRLSRPIATILLALIAVPLGRASPRQGKGEKGFIAALIFAIYYNLSGLAQTWVEQGVVSSLPGVWWLYILMLVLMLAMLLPSPWHKWKYLR